MRLLTFIIFSFIFFSIIHTQDSKKITEKYFPDFDIEVPTPAFNILENLKKRSKFPWCI